MRLEEVVGVVGKPPGHDDIDDDNDDDDEVDDVADGDDGDDDDDIYIMMSVCL